MELTNNDFAGHLFRNRLMWMGFIAAGGIDVINGLHFLYPTVPTLGGRLYDIGPLFTEKPWNAIGWTPVAVYPFIIGLSFFIPLDLSFSCWFFLSILESSTYFISGAGLAKFTAISIHR